MQKTGKKETISVYQHALTEFKLSLRFLLNITVSHDEL